jgi:hypothetical protein
VSETPVAGALRAWLAVEVGFALAAILAVFLFPEQTDANFAWPAKPPVMAAVLGAFYLASALLFVGGLFVRRWEHLRVIILPAAVFTALELLVTFLHWDRFKVGTLPFTVWFASYLLPPPVFASCYWWQQRRAAPVRWWGRAGGGAATEPLPAWLWRLCVVDGVALVAVFALLLAAPGLLLPRGPWALTPLTTRALCAWLISLGLLLLSIAAENDWPRARLATAMPIALGPVLLIQLARFRDQVSWGHPGLLLLLADVLLVGGALAWRWTRSAAGAGGARSPSVGSDHKSATRGS